VTLGDRLDDLTRQEFADLLEFRTLLHRFLRWREQEARAAGLTPVQHQLLVTIKGHPGDRAPTVGEIAESLVLRHHSTVELIDRAEGAGLVERWPDPEDGRIVRISLTKLGEARLGALAMLHLTEIQLRALVTPFLEKAISITPPLQS
jgi:DNA-binding MarR family transcriptional regulator